MAKYPIGLLEEELKNKVAADWFAAYDTTRIIGKVDFCVAVPATELGLFESENALWAEAKAGVRKDIHESFVQLILTIGRARTFDTERPPLFLGAFDAEKIAFLPYNAVQDVFAQNDFNWNVAPSNHESKEFGQLYSLAEKTIVDQSLLFDFVRDEAELRRFIKVNFKTGRTDVSRIQIDKNNFTHIYRKWREAVLPHIDAPWDVLKSKYSLYDRDFYLAELNVDDNGTVDVADDRVANDFYITFNVNEKNKYRIQRTNADELAFELTFGFKSDEGLAAYAAFWRRYKRPPRKDYWSYIVKRIDLLVPQDVRERKGAFFTPQKWVELSQEYLARELGENWQDEYDVWDCCAGTGNMEAGLTNKYKVWASTLDQQDVDVMHERIKNGANLLESHVFQFDFLNDSFDKLPPGLREIIDDPERRKKLVIYINPPYAEHSNRKVIVGTGDNRTNVAKLSKVYKEFSSQVGAATRELYVQFFLRIYQELHGAVLASFSTLKFVCSQNCAKFRESWLASFVKAFICPADTFDNVNGDFPIAFSIWHLGGKSQIKGIVADVMEHDAHYVGEKAFYACESKRMISDWLRQFYVRGSKPIGYLSLPGVSMQQRASLFLTSKPTESDVRQHKVAEVTSENVLPCAVYLAVRHCILPEWTNNKDEFRYPNDAWKCDREFWGDCLVWVNFDNSVKSSDGPNHWIPFTEAEVDAKECFASHFMSDFLAGRGRAVCLKPPFEGCGGLGQTALPGLEGEISHAEDAESAEGEDGGCANALRSPRSPREIQLSPAARAVLDAGRELWRYYHAQPGANPNASYYDIRRHFQGMKKTASGKEQMNATSDDVKYNNLLAALKSAMKKLAKQIEPKVYAYGFLKK